MLYPEKFGADSVGSSCETDMWSRWLDVEYKLLRERIKDWCKRLKFSLRGSWGGCGGNTSRGGGGTLSAMGEVGC